MWLAETRLKRLGPGYDTENYTKDNKKAKRSVVSPPVLSNGTPQICDRESIIIVLSARPKNEVFACDIIWREWYLQGTKSDRMVSLYIFSSENLQGTWWHDKPNVVDMSRYWSYQTSVKAYCETTLAQLNLDAFKCAIKQFQADRKNPALFPRMIATISDTDLPLVSHDYMASMEPIGYLGGTDPIAWICLDGQSCTILHEIVSAGGDCIVQFSRLFTMFSTSCPDEFWFYFLPRTSDEFTDYLTSSRINSEPANHRLRAFNNARLNSNPTTIYNYKSPGNLMSPLTFTTLDERQPITIHNDKVSGLALHASTQKDEITGEETQQFAYMEWSLRDVLVDALRRFPFDNLVDRKKGVNGALFFRKVSPANDTEETKIKNWLSRFWTAHLWTDEERRNANEQFNSYMSTAVALADFAAEYDVVLPLKEGEVLQVLDMQAPEGWLMAQNSAGRQGLVPAKSYLAYQFPRPQMGKPNNFDLESQRRADRVKQMIQARKDMLSMVDLGECSVTDIMTSPRNGCATVWLARLKKHVIDTTINILSFKAASFEYDYFVDDKICYDRKMTCDHVAVFARDAATKEETSIAEMPIEDESSLKTLKTEISNTSLHFPPNTLIQCTLRVAFSAE